MSDFAKLRRARGDLTGRFSRARAEVIPPKPAGYFNDYAGVVSKTAVSRFNDSCASRARNFEPGRGGGFPKCKARMTLLLTPTCGSNLGVEKGAAKCAVLFVFTQDRKMFIKSATVWKVRSDATASTSPNTGSNALSNNDYEGGLPRDRSISRRSAAIQRNRNDSTERRTACAAAELSLFPSSFVVLSLSLGSCESLAAQLFVAPKRRPGLIPMGFGGGGGGPLAEAEAASVDSAVAAAVLAAAGAGSSW